MVYVNHMLTSNVAIWSPLLNFLVPSSPTEAGRNSLELPLVVREQFFRRLVGYVYTKGCLATNCTCSWRRTLFYLHRQPALTSVQLYMLLFADCQKDLDLPSSRLKCNGLDLVFLNLRGFLAHFLKPSTWSLTVHNKMLQITLCSFLGFEMTSSLK